ncbi:MAG TPA: polysaccharide biosynthesis/export family protein [Verrucomicrobiae bacterium]|nr:polysaccharide biosynthesis/export family protein [Verrucomicrobiae bacterium]
MGKWAGWLGILGFAVALAGCQSNAPVFIDPGIPGTETNGNTRTEYRGPTDILHKGDLVTVTFSGPTSEVPIPQHEERIKEDGTITPPSIGSVMAAGKTSGDLQKELQEKYNKLYRNLTVTVKSGDRFYYVLGEVMQPGPKPYLGETDIIKAITAGSGFTEYAKKSKIKLIHPNGKTEIVNYDKAVEDQAKNLPVYPGDQVIVPRRLF